MVSFLQWAYLFLFVLIFAGLAVSIIRTRRYHKQLVSPLRGVIAPLRNASQYAGLLAYHKNRYVLEHIGALAQNDNSTSPAISYRLSYLARAVTPFPLVNTPNTVICSLAVGEEYRRTVEPCIESQRRYAERHGIAYCVVEHAPPSFERPSPWLKLPLILSLIDAGATRILFIDADAMITNFHCLLDAKFRQIENSNKLILVTEDEAGLNTGVMFISGRPLAKRMLDLIWLYDAEIHNGTWEQNSARILMSTLPEFARYVDIDPDPKNFNSFPVERNLVQSTREKQVWSEQDFICHFSGLRGEHLHRYIRDYERAIARERQRQSTISRVAVSQGIE